MRVQVAPAFVHGWIVYKDTSANTTCVDVVAAPAGAWDFVAAPGTSLIENVKTAGGVPIPIVSAGITGTKGDAYVIRFRVFREPRGDNVTLEETDGSGTPVTFATLPRTHGAVRYVPSSDLPGAKRAIIAVVTRGARQVSAQSGPAASIVSASSSTASSSSEVISSSSGHGYMILLHRSR